MYNLFTRMSMLVIAFGFFISCSKPYETITRSAEALSSEELFNRATEYRLLEPESPRAHHLEGMAHLQLARQQAADLREDHYRSMRNSFASAISRYGNDRAAMTERQGIRETLQNVWSYEHNSAAGLVSSDSLRNRQRMSLAAAHAHNAIVIIPDSLISYELLAEIYARQGSIDQAIRVLTGTESRLYPQSGRTFETIAYLYYQLAEYDNAVEWYEKAAIWYSEYAHEHRYPSDAALYKGSLLNLRHGLINAYISNGQHGVALDEIMALHEQYPGDVRYPRLIVAQLITLINDAVEPGSSENVGNDLIRDYLGRASSFIQHDTTLQLEYALALTDIAGRYVESRYIDDDSFSPASDASLMLISYTAIAIYSELLSSDPDNTTAIAGIADTYLLTGNEAEASMWYERLEN